MMIMCAWVTSCMSVCFMGMMPVTMCVWCDCRSVNFVFMSMVFVVVVVLMTTSVVVRLFMVVMEAMVVNTSSFRGDVTQSSVPV